MIWFARWNGWSSALEQQRQLQHHHHDEANSDTMHFFIPRVHEQSGTGSAGSGAHPPRSSRGRGVSRSYFTTGRDSSGSLRIFMSETGRGPPLVMRRQPAWTVGSKLVAAGAGLILLVGVALSLLTVNARMDMDTYRPFIFTIFGVLFVIVGPMIACRMVLNAYDRRLMREQRQFETFAQRLQRRSMSAQRNNGSGSVPLSLSSRAQLAVEYLLRPGGVQRQRDREASLSERSLDPADLFPDALPSYGSALDLKSNEHWMKKFFRDPPPPYLEAVELQPMGDSHRGNTSSRLLLLPPLAVDRGANNASNAVGVAPAAICPHHTLVDGSCESSSTGVESVDNCSAACSSSSRVRLQCSIDRLRSASMTDLPRAFGTGECGTCGTATRIEAGDGNLACGGANSATPTENNFDNVCTTTLANTNNDNANGNDNNITTNPSSPGPSVHHSSSKETDVDNTALGSAIMCECTVHDETEPLNNV